MKPTLAEIRAAWDNYGADERWQVVCELHRKLEQALEQADAMESLGESCLQIAEEYVPR